MAYLLIIFVLFILVLWSLSYIQKRGEKIKKQKNYIKGLEYFADGDIEKALDSLNLAWKEDPNNIDAYLRVGDILRKKGKVKSAIKIHLNLSVKPFLPNEKKTRILESLAEDYITADMKNSAIATMKKLIAMKGGDDNLKKKLIVLFEKTYDWGKAYDYARGFFKDKKKLAEYGGYIGLKMLDKNPEEAMKYIKPGLRVGLPFSKFVYARYHLQKGSVDEALKIYKDLLSSNPEYAEYALPELGKVMFEKGEYSGIESIFKNILEKDPHNLETLRCYVSFLVKKGDKNKALDLVTNADFPENSPEFLCALIDIYQMVDDRRLKDILPKVREVCLNKSHFTCKECGYESQVFDWKCNNCFSIGSLVRMWD